MATTVAAASRRLRAQAVGLDPMVAALENLAELNLVRRRAGAVWNLLTYHADIERRVDRPRAKYTAAAAHGPFSPRARRLRDRSAGRQPLGVRGRHPGEETEADCQPEQSEDSKRPVDV